MSVISQCIRSIKLIDGIIKRHTAELPHEDALRQLPFPSN